MRKNVCLVVLLCGCGAVYAAWEGPVAEGVEGSRMAECVTEKVPCVRLWEQMSAAERARLWPFLDEVAKTSYWRQMSGDDRRELRKHLSSAEREQLRNRYSVKHEGERRAGRHLGGMCDEKRSELRRQVMEVHMQFRRSHRGYRPAAEASAPRRDRLSFLEGRFGVPSLFRGVAHRDRYNETLPIKPNPK